jgi:hypothetical protein
MPQLIGQVSPMEGVLVDWALAQSADLPRLPVELLSREQKAAELRRLQGRKAMDAAYEAELVLGLAADTPDTLDPPADQPGGVVGAGAGAARGVAVLHV